MQQKPQVHPLVFTGRGGEYFRIWIVNLLLTILTVGIYSAWAKVRRLQYFYRNTSVAGGSFDYHGDPMAILKGRLIGVGVLIVYAVVSEIHPIIELVLALLLVLSIPWLLQRSLRYKLSVTSYRGLRFRFDGDVAGAYWAFLVWPLLGVISFGLLFPMAQQRATAYQYGNARYGDALFGFDADAGDFYSIYLQLAGILIGAALVAGLLWSLLGIGGGVATTGDIGEAGGLVLWAYMGMAFGIVVVFLLGSLIIRPWLTARFQNLIWGAMTLGRHRFASQVRARDLLVLQVTNFILMVITLGLYKPYADIIMAKYRLQQTSLKANGSLDDILAGKAAAAGATASETAEMLDLELAF